MTPRFRISVCNQRFMKKTNVKNSSWNIINYTRFTREVIGIYWELLGVNSLRS